MGTIDRYLSEVEQAEIRRSIADELAEPGLYSGVRVQTHSPDPRASAARQFFVTWSIDIEGAASFRDAAAQAFAHMRRVGTTATVFTVREVTPGANGTWTIDLDDAAEDAVLAPAEPAGTVWTLYVRFRSWSEHQAVYASREALERAVIAFASRECDGEPAPTTLDGAIEVMNSADHAVVWAAVKVRP